MVPAQREVKRHSTAAQKLRRSFVLSEGVEVEMIYKRWLNGIFRAGLHGWVQTGPRYFALTKPGSETLELCYCCAQVDLPCWEANRVVWLSNQIWLLANQPGAQAEWAHVCLHPPMEIGHRGCVSHNCKDTVLTYSRPQWASHLWTRALGLSWPEEEQLMQKMFQGTWAEGSGETEDVWISESLWKPWVNSFVTTAYCMTVLTQQRI